MKPSEEQSSLHPHTARSAGKNPDRTPSSTHFPTSCFLASPFSFLNPSVYQGPVLPCFEQAARPGHPSVPVEFGCSGNRARSSGLVCFQPSYSCIKYTEMKAIPKNAEMHPLED